MNTHTDLPLLSVIIPVYNVAPFLTECLNSIISQSYQNLEILLIDDGSSDGSSALCDNLAHTDNRIKVYHKPNGGVSSARNLALLNSTGAYFSFIDADDYVSPEMFSTMMQLCLENNTDAVFCSSERFYNSNPSKTFPLIAQHEGIVDVTTALEEILYSGIGTGCCNKIFSRKLIFENNTPILFNESLAIGEDALWCIKVLSNAGTVAISTAPLYFYRIHENSATQSTTDLAKRFTSIEARKQMLLLLTEYPYKLQKRTKAQLYKILVILLKESNKQSIFTQYSNYLKDLKIGRKAFYLSKEYSLILKLQTLLADISLHFI